MRNFIVSLLTSFAVVVAALNLPASYFTLESVRFGNVNPTSITTATGLANFPAIYNANNTLLDAGKIDVGTTSVTSITTLPSLSLPASQLSGTVAVANGGTASTTLSANNVLIGNGASGIKVIGYGTSGQFLTSGGAGTAPSWTSGSVDTTQNYNWTGINRFSTLHSSSSITFATGATSKAWSFPLVDAASSSVLSSNGSGTLTFETLAQIGAGGSFIASTTDTNVNDTASDTNYGAGTILTIPAGQLGSTGTLYARAYITNYTISAGAEAVTVKLKLGGTTVCNVDLPAPTSATGQSLISFTLVSTSTTAQVCQSIAQVGLSATTIATRYSETFSAVNTASAQAVTMTAAWSANTGATESFTFGGVTVGYLGR